MKFADLLEHSDVNADDSTGQEIPEDEWRYAVSKKEDDLVEGQKVKMKTDKGIYAGEWVTNMIESRRYRPKSYTWLGYTENPKRGIQEAGVPHNALFKHTAIFGNSGYGKSTVVKNMMLQWAQAGFGMCFVDPKGDDSLKILKTLPEHRLDDIIWVEPGATSKRETVGFNILDTLAEPGTPEQESEADAVVEDIIGLFETISPQWSPQMAGVVSAVLGRMIRAKENYTLIDLYKVLDSQAEREAFLDMYGDEMDNMDYEYVENLEPHEVDPVTNLLKQIISKPLMRNIVASPDSNANIAKAIEGDKIIIANFSNIADDNLEQVTAFLVRRLWSTIKARKDIPEHERDPFFLCLDEFDNLTKDFQDAEDMLRVDEILSTARSFRLSVLVANQNPTQLAEDIKQHVYGNCNNLFTFNQGNFQDAGDLAQGIKDIDARQVMGLSEFRLLGRLTIDGDKTPGLLIHTFPEYPPLRTEEGSLEVLDDSCARYGSSRTGDFDENDHGVIRFKDESTDETTLTEGGETIDLRNVLVTLDSATANPNLETHQGAVPEEHLVDLFDDHTNVFTYEDIKSDIISPNLNDEFEEVQGERGAFYNLTDTGESALNDALDDETRDIFKRAYETLAELGYSVTTPIRDDEAIHYDLISYPPINPVADAETMEMAGRLDAILASTYPELHDRFGDRTVVGTVIPDPITHPRHIVYPLVTADDTEHCLFILPETTFQGRDAIEAIEDLFGTVEDSYELYLREDDDGRRVFYTTTQPIDVDHTVRGLHRSDDAFWREGDDGGYVLESDDGDIICRFDSFEHIDYHASTDDFPYYAQQLEDSLAVKTKANSEDVEDDEIVGEYESFDEVFDDGFTLITEPLVPERAFPEGLPKHRDEWTLLIVPEDGEPYFHDE